MVEVLDKDAVNVAFAASETIFVFSLSSDAVNVNDLESVLKNPLTIDTVNVALAAIDL
jgi:hypothetical protein